MATFRELLDTVKTAAGDLADTSAKVDTLTAALVSARSQAADSAAAKAAADATLAAAIFARGGDLTDPTATPPVVYRSPDGKTLLSDPGIGLDEPAPDPTPAVARPATA